MVLLGLGLLVVPVLVLEGELLVLARLIDLKDVLVSLLHHFGPDVIEVSGLGAFLYFICNLWVLHEDFLIEELLGDGDGLHVFFS